MLTRSDGLTPSTQLEAVPEDSYTPRLVSSFTSCCNRVQVPPVWQIIGEPRFTFMSSAVCKRRRLIMIQLCVAVALQSELQLFASSDEQALGH